MKLFFLIQKGSRALVIALLAALLIFGVALAYVTINTNDGSIDAAWSTTPFLTDADDVPDTGMDILKFWVGVDSSKSNFYFRAELDAPLASGTNWLEARMDCDRDGVMESTDVVVEYVGYSDNVYTANGNWTTWDSVYGTAYGEYIASNNYEWRSPTSGGNVSWSACLSNNINIDLVTYHNDGETSYIVDQTSWRGYNVPTVVQMQQFNGSSAQDTNIVLLVIGSIGVAGISLWRRSHKLEL